MKKYGVFLTVLAFGLAFSLPAWSQTESAGTSGIQAAPSTEITIHSGAMASSEGMKITVSPGAGNTHISVLLPQAAPGTSAGAVGTSEEYRSEVQESERFAESPWVEEGLTSRQEGAPSYGQSSFAAGASEQGVTITIQPGTGFAAAAPDITSRPPGRVEGGPLYNPSEEMAFRESGSSEVYAQQIESSIQDMDRNIARKYDVAPYKLNEYQEKKAAVQARIEDLRAADPDQWSEARARLDSAFNELANTYRDVM